MKPIPFKLPARSLSGMFTPSREDRQQPAVYEDDRSDEQRKTHRQLIGGKDSFMSGWGQAPNDSYAYWACRLEDAEKVAAWVQSRSDIKYFAVRLDSYPRRGRGTHTHVYVVTPGHPALGER